MVRVCTAHVTVHTRQNIYCLTAYNFPFTIMLDHLRHTLILLSVGLLFFSCSTDEPDTSGREMKFDISSVSRSAVTTAENITKNPFAVFADRIPSNLADNQSALRSTVYHNTPVTYTTSGWTTSEVQFWFHNHEHSFVAIHPASVLSANDANISYLNSQLSFSYTLPSDHTQTADLLAATHRRRYTENLQFDDKGNITGGQAEAVYLQFNHMLTQINLSPAFYDNNAGKDAFIQVHKIVLSGFKNNATFNILPSSLQSTAQTDDRAIEVKDQKGSGDLTITYAKPIIIKNDKQNVSLFGKNDAIIMLPQSFAENSDAKIIFSYSYNNDETIKDVTFSLQNMKWEIGKSYNYSFTIERLGITLESTAITDWDLMNVGNINAR